MQFDDDEHHHHRHHGLTMNYYGAFRIKTCVRSRSVVDWQVNFDRVIITAVHLYY